MKKTFKQVVKELNLPNEVTDIAEALPHNKGGVSRYLKSDKEPPAKFLMKFCKAFNLDYVELFGEKEDEYQSKYYALLEQNQKTQDVIIEMLKPIVGTQETIASLMQKMQEDNKRVMERLYDSVHAQRSELTKINSSLQDSVEASNQLTRYVQTGSILARKYYSQKENKAGNEIDNEFDYIFRLLGSKDNVGGSSVGGK